MQRSDHHDHGVPAESDQAKSITPRRLRLSNSGCVETESYTPASSTSPSSTRSRIAPSRFHNLAQYWHQRVTRRDVSNVSPSCVGDGTFTQAPASSAPTTSSQLDVDGKESTPESSCRSGPTPRKLCNLLEEDPLTPSLCRVTGADLRMRHSSLQQYVYATPSTNTTLRTPERCTPGTGTSSSTSIMSIATPIKSPQVGNRWGGETEMELALDLVNHVPANMMNRLGDVWQSSRIEKLEFQDEEASPRGKPARRHAACARASSTLCCCLCRASLMIGGIIVLGTTFLAGFLTHMAFESYAAHPKNSAGYVAEKSNDRLAYTGFELQSLWPLVEPMVTSALPVGGTFEWFFMSQGAGLGYLLQDWSTHMKQMVDAAPTPNGVSSQAHPALSTTSLQRSVTPSWRYPEPVLPDASVDHSAIQIKMDANSSSTSTTTVVARHSTTAVGHDMKVAVDGNSMQLSHETSSHIAYLNASHGDGLFSSYYRYLAEAEYEEMMAQFGREGPHFRTPSRSPAISSTSPARSRTGDFQQWCLNAAASWRASGASVNVREGDLFAEYACFAAAEQDGARSDSHH